MDMHQTHSTLPSRWGNCPFDKAGTKLIKPLTTEAHLGMPGTHVSDHLPCAHLHEVLGWIQTRLMLKWLLAFGFSTWVLPGLMVIWFSLLLSAWVTQMCLQHLYRGITVFQTVYIDVFPTSQICTGLCTVCMNLLYKGWYLCAYVFLSSFWKWQACIGVYQIMQETCLYTGLDVKEWGMSVKGCSQWNPVLHWHT